MCVCFVFLVRYRKLVIGCHHGLCLVGMAPACMVSFDAKEGGQFLISRVKIKTLLSFKFSDILFIMLINIKNSNNRWHFNIYKDDNFHAQFSCMKKFNIFRAICFGTSMPRSRGYKTFLHAQLN